MIPTSHISSRKIIMSVHMYGVMNVQCCVIADVVELFGLIHEDPLETDLCAT